MRLLLIWEVSRDDKFYLGLAKPFVAQSPCRCARFPNESHTYFAWETSVKFYLFYRHELIGPCGREHFKQKLERSFNHQIKLFETPAGKKFLYDMDIEGVTHQLFLKGMIFYPLEEFLGKNWEPASTYQTFQLSKTHLTGWWCYLNKFKTLSALFNENQFSICNRLDWLTPLTKAPTLSFDDTCRKLEDILGIDPFKALMIRSQTDDGTTQTGFICPEKWPQITERKFYS